MDFCFTCGGEGKEGGCPSCGKDSKKLIVKEEKKERFIKSAQFKQIPNQYIGVVWSKQTLIDNHPDYQKDLNFLEFASRLEKLHEAFKGGSLPNCTVFISAESKMSKNILAYSCMQFAMKNNMTVSPIIDTVELKLLLTQCGENPNWKLYGYIDYNKYITSHVCFLTVTKLDKHREAYTPMIELVSRRARLGLPTFIISKFGLKEISTNCIDNDYEKFIDNVGHDNALRYPSIIEY